MPIPKFKEPIVYIDVDDTLVSWAHGFFWHEGALEFEDPYDGATLYLDVIKEHVDAIKSHKLRGHTVVVWSAGGADWAEEVVKRLHLEKHVDAVLAKPNWFYDDLPANRILEEIHRKHYILKGRQ